MSNKITVALPPLCAAMSPDTTQHEQAQYAGYALRAIRINDVDGPGIFIFSALGKSVPDILKNIAASASRVEKRRKNLRPSTRKTYTKDYDRHFRKRIAGSIMDILSGAGVSDTYYVSRAAIPYAAVEKHKELSKKMKQTERRIKQITALRRIAKEALKHAQTEEEKTDYKEEIADLATELKDAQKTLGQLKYDILLVGNDLYQSEILASKSQDLMTRRELIQKQKEYDKMGSTIAKLTMDKPEKLAPSEWTAAANNGNVTPAQRGANSKKKTVGFLTDEYPNWRNLGYCLVAKKWRPFTAIASLCGARSVEIRHIVVEKDPHPDRQGWLMFRVNEAKNQHKDEAITFHTTSVKDAEDSEAFKFLWAQVEQHGSYSVTPPTKCQGKDLNNVEGAFRQALNKAGDKFIISPEGERYTLAPYCFRHSFAADAKANGMDKVDLAIGMGHSSTDTQKWYGNKSMGQKGMRQIYVHNEGQAPREVIKQYPPAPMPAPAMAPQITVDVHPAQQDVSLFEAPAQSNNDQLTNEDFGF